MKPQAEPVSFLGGPCIVEILSTLVSKLFSPSLLSYMLVPWISSANATGAKSASNKTSRTRSEEEGGSVKPLLTSFDDDSCSAAFLADLSLLHARAALALRSLRGDDVVDAEQQARRLRTIKTTAAQHQLARPSH